jgi:predicted metal-dependent phosphoesterase TrpH
VSLVDLHIHSTASDGKLSPSEIVRKAAANGMKVIAICDHDTVDGISEALTAASSVPGIRVIPGIEISTDVPQGEIHILGYFINYNDKDFLAALSRMQNSRLNRARKMVTKLEGLGVKIDWSRVQEIAGESTIGRPHIAQALIEKGYIKDFREAFEKYIGHGGPAYVERDKMTPAQAVSMIVTSGGLPVFAHPVTFIGYESMTLELLPFGLAGMEVYYKNSSPEELARTRGITQKLGLIPTGGSDFHGIEAGEVGIGDVDVPLSSAEKLINMHEKRIQGGN